MEEKKTDTLTEQIERWESIYADTVRRKELMEMGFKAYWANKVNDTSEIDEIKHDVDLVKEAEYEVDLSKKTLNELKAQYLAELKAQSGVQE